MPTPNTTGKTSRTLRMDDTVYAKMLANAEAMGMTANAYMLSLLGRGVLSDYNTLTSVSSMQSTMEFMTRASEELVQQEKP